MMSECPSDIEMRRFLAQELANDERSRIEEHLTSCPVCTVRLNSVIEERAAAPRSRAIAHDAQTLVGNRELAAVTMSPSDASTQAAQSIETPIIIVEGYRVIREVARGGMGVIYEAVQLKLNRRVALKVLPSMGSGANEQAITRFRHEATAAAKLHHTHIVPIYDFGQSGHTYYYAMELVEGRPLTEMIRRFAEGNAPSAASATIVDMVRGVEPGSAVRGDSSSDSTSSSMSGFSSQSTSRGRVYFRHVAHWMANAADALHYAHSHDIIHRDIKPGNLMLCTDGRIMILDFGLAKSLSDVSVTTTGALVGTLRYMSPEQAMAKRMKVDHRTDIYSLGATMYELLTFQPAFRGSDEKETLGLIITKDATPPRKIIPEVPKEMETICLKTMEKDPGARYATAKDLADDLRRFIQDLPIVAKPVGPVGRTIKFVRRHRAMTLAACATLLLAVALVFTVKYNRQARQSALDAKGLRIKNLDEEIKKRWEKKEWEEAEKLFEKLLEEDPTNYNALTNLAGVKRLRAGEHASAEVLDQVNGLLDRAIRVDPARPETWNIKGILLRDRGKYDESITAHRKGISADPRKFSNWISMSGTYALMDELKEAERCLMTGLDIAGKTAGMQPWHNLAAVQHQLGKADALKSVEKALQIAGGDSTATVKLLEARIHLSGKSKADFKQALNAAITADNLFGANHKNARAVRILALAQLRSEHWTEAREEAERALKLGDEPSWPRLILAIVEAREGHAGAAQGDIDAANAAWPAELSSHPRMATISGSLLWFDSATELEQLRAEAQGLLGPH